MICWSFSFTAVDRCCFLCCKSVLCSDSEPPITTFTTQFDNHHQLSRGFVFIAGQLLWWWITWVGIYLSICGSCPRYLVRDREHHNWGTSPSILWQKIGSRGGGIFIIGLDFLIRIVSLVQWDRDSCPAQIASIGLWTMKGRYNIKDGCATKVHNKHWLEY